jgi:hypothetical protein
VVWLSDIISCLDLVQLNFTDWAAVIPGLVCSFTNRALSRGGLVDLSRAIFRVVRLSTVATCCVRFTLGSYVAVFLAIVALLQSALSVVPFALKRLALPDETFVDDLVCVFWVGKLDNDSGC